MAARIQTSCKPSIVVDRVWWWRVCSVDAARNDRGAGLYDQTRGAAVLHIRDWQSKLLLHSFRFGLGACRCRRAWGTCGCLRRCARPARRRWRRCRRCGGTSCACTPTTSSPARPMWCAFWCVSALLVMHAHCHS